MWGYLVVYALGVVTPMTMKKFVLPKVKHWIKDKVNKWRD